MTALTTASNKSLNTLLTKVVKVATINEEGFYSRVRVTSKQKALIDKFCKRYEFTAENGVTYEVSFSEPGNDQLPVYFYGKALVPTSEPVAPIVKESVVVPTVSKTQLKKDLAEAKRTLKEVSKEYDRVACRSINPEVDVTVIRVLGQKYDLKAKVAELESQLADLAAS